MTNQSEAIRIELGDGKYTYIFDAKEHKALRYGEEWRDLTGDNLILQMGMKLEEQENRIAELEQKLKESDEEHDVMQEQCNINENALDDIKAIFVDEDDCPLFEPFTAENLVSYLAKSKKKAQIDGINNFANEKCGKVISEYERQLNKDAFYFCENLKKELTNGV